MNRADFQQTGGFPLETDTVAFLQDTFMVLQEMVALGGDNYILSGCTVNGPNASNGHVVINGELLPFVGGLIQNKVVIKESVSGRLFQNGATKNVYRTRVAQFGTGVDFVLWADLVRIKDLKTFRNLPHQSSSAIDSAEETVLATSKAVKTVYDLLKNQVAPGIIVIWGGTIDTIPQGWGLCDGTEGRPDLRDRFVLGAGNQYGLYQTGGAATHTLTISEMPRHNHTYNPGDNNGTSDNANDRTVKIPGGEGRSTDYSGGDMPHNNMPPYYSLAYIIKL